MNIHDPIIYPVETSQEAKVYKLAGEVARGKLRTTCVVTCEGCRERFLATPYKVSVGRARFCSRSCAGRAAAAKLPPEFYQGERNPNFKNWASRNKRAYVERYRAKYPEKAAANDAVERAVRSGKLIRPETCSECGCKPSEPVHGHHDDYSKPLSVRWLCRGCHLRTHGAQVA